MNHMRINKPSPLSWKALNLSTFFCLYIAQAIPMSFFSTAIQVLMRQADYSLSSIALLQLIKLPWILKFLWAPLIDRHCITLKDYKRCIITSEIVYALLILLVGLLDIQTDLYLIIGLVFLSLIASATQDIATDTLAVLSFGKSDKSLVNSMQSMGSFGGTLIGTGILLLVLQHYGWHVVIPSSFLAGLLVRKIGRYHSRILFAIFILLTTLYFMCISWTAPSFSMLCLGIVLLWSAYGMATIVVYTTSMDCVRKGCEGTDFTIQTVLTHLSGLLIAFLRGVVADRTGYHGLFIFEVILASISLIYIFYFFRKESQPIHS